MCLDYFEFDYYDTIYNESAFMQTVKAPFQPRMEFELLNSKIPCSDDFAFIARVSKCEETFLTKGCIHIFLSKEGPAS